VTDDSHAARRGGDPPGEEADATAPVVQQEVVQQEVVQQEIAQPEVVQPEAAAGPAKSEQGARAEEPGPPANQQYRYGPFHGGDEQQSEAYPISGAWSVGPPPRDWTQETAPTAAPDAGYGPAQTPHGGTPAGAGPAYRPEAMDSAYPPEVTEPADEPESTPTSGTGPVYRPGDPVETPPPWSATDPVSGGGALPDPYGFVVTPSYAGGPRIEPTPKQPKGRRLRPALAGLLAGLLIFGTGGWFLGRATQADPSPAAAPTPGPTGTATDEPEAGAYEQNQIAINRPKLTGTLGTISLGWLPQLSACSRSGDKGGPALNDGEKVRVRCEMDAMSIIFVEYDSAGERDKARGETVGQNGAARRLTPGVGAAEVRASPSGRTDGNYVEFAYQADGKTVSGIWWDDTATPVAAYLLAFWKDGVREKWEPMRDVWARYA